MPTRPWVAPVLHSVKAAAGAGSLAPRKAAASQALTLLRTGAKGQTSAERQGVPFSLEEHLPALKYVVFYSGEKEVLSMR